MSAPFALQFPPELLEAIAYRAAELLREREPALPDYMTAAEAASYMRCGSKQRVYDLVSQGRLEPCRDGSRLLFKRSTVDAYLSDTSLRPYSASRTGERPGTHPRRS